MSCPAHARPSLRSEPICLSDPRRFALQVATRRNNTAQMVLFVIIMAAVYMAERLNTIAAANWERFSTQNYFDKQGVFVSTMWSMPLLLIGVVMLFQSLYSASSLLVQVSVCLSVCLSSPTRSPPFPAPLYSVSSLLVVSQLPTESALQPCNAWQGPQSSFQVYTWNVAGEAPGATTSYATGKGGQGDTRWCGRDEEVQVTPRARAPSSPCGRVHGKDVEKETLGTPGMKTDFKICIESDCRPATRLCRTHVPAKVDQIALSAARCTLLIWAQILRLDANHSCHFCNLYPKPPTTENRADGARLSVVLHSPVHVVDLDTSTDPRHFEEELNLGDKVALLDAVVRIYAIGREDIF